jgi:uncharacterized protein YecE (DUF72 family)
MGVAVTPTRARVGVLLVQLPPDQERDEDGLDYFLRGLPEWMRVAVELRHRSWAVDAVFDLFSRHHATYVVMSGARPALCAASHLDNGLCAAPRP